ncbi:hypothetical protein D0T84_05340 [Dysgonomonas sp. 521]|uniref:hypothetical protein n=1 Tax=Dysgonomonas sp. 521 TaxID=2302932 RepID=UPI0013D49DD1|nr:hypothetical protein [Dysgonomonas sp. 521]NDV94342.1 hypothetical protein [Dysgonomonas sp. 521]
MSTSIRDFEFNIMKYGLYEVIYTSPNTGKKWKAVINDMTLIDATKNAKEPRVKKLNELKKKIKCACIRE